MSTTTPPPGRVRTPPTPLHGARFDNHDTFSPRRSSRLSTMRNSADPAHSLGRTSTTKVKSRSDSSRPVSNHALSPPSSPASPRRVTKSPASHKKSKGVDFAGRGSLSQDRIAPEPDSDLDMDDPSHLKMPRSNGNNAGMLPTPVKTPRKRTLGSHAKLNSTARILFPNRPADPNELMPSPRKSRKGRKHNAYTLESFAAEYDNDEGDDIPIYTDTKEQIPTEDDAEDNPFIIRKGSKKKLERSPPRSTEHTSSRSKYGMGAEIDRAVENNEGMVYVFRGRKVYRKFDDPDNEATVDPTDANAEVLRRAGTSGRFTRSSIKPRLLFPPKEDPIANDNDADEEAVTDIEGANPGTSSGRHEDKVVTPVKQQFRPVTPPTTVKKTRGMGAVDSSDSSPMEYDGHVDAHATRERKTSPFDSWTRSKSGRSSGGPPAKRQGQHMEGDRGDGKASVGKRLRGDAVPES